MESRSFPQRLFGFIAPGISQQSAGIMAIGLFGLVIALLGRSIIPDLILLASLCVVLMAGPYWHYLIKAMRR